MSRKDLLYPTPEKHCLGCFHCKRVISGKGKEVGNIALTEVSPTDIPIAPIRCDLGYWGELPDGSEKRYRSPWIAVKSTVLMELASRCPDFDDQE